MDDNKPHTQGREVNEKKGAAQPPHPFTPVNAPVPQSSDGSYTPAGGSKSTANSWQK